MKGFAVYRKSHDFLAQIRLLLDPRPGGKRGLVFFYGLSQKADAAELAPSPGAESASEMETQPADWTRFLCLRCQPDRVSRRPPQDPFTDHLMPLCPELHLGAACM